jgi:hypothetical protein
LRRASKTFKFCKADTFLLLMEHNYIERRWGGISRTMCSLIFMENDHLIQAVTGKRTQSIHPFIHLRLCSHLLDLGRSSVSLFFTQSIGLLGWVISPSQDRYLHRPQTQNKRTETFMLQVGFETTIPVFESYTAHPP